MNNTSINSSLVTIVISWPKSLHPADSTQLDVLLSLGLNKTKIKQYLSNQFLEKKIFNDIDQINMGVAYSYPIDLINNLKIKSVEIYDQLNLPMTFPINFPKILFQYPDFTVIHKDPFWHSVPKNYTQENHVLSALRSMDLAHLYPLYPKNLDGGLIHRLDYETSGLLILAKSQAFYDDLRSNYSTLAKNKIYHAWVFGNVQQKENKQSGTLNHYMVPSGPKGKVMKILDSAKIDQNSYHDHRASLHWKLLEISTCKNYSKLEISLKTGLRHQIRSQLSHWGFPILGDTLYGNLPIEHHQHDPSHFTRMYLHHQQFIFEYLNQLFDFINPITLGPPEKITLSN